MNLREINQIAWELTAGLTYSKNDETMKGKIRDLLMHLSAGLELDDFKTVVESYRPQARDPRSVATKQKKLRDFYNAFRSRTAEMDQKERIQTLRYILWNIGFYEKGSSDSLKMGIMAEGIRTTEDIKSMIKRKQKKRNNQKSRTGGKRKRDYRSNDQGYGKRR